MFSLLAHAAVLLGAYLMASTMGAFSTGASPDAKKYEPLEVALADPAPVEPTPPPTPHMRPEKTVELPVTPAPSDLAAARVTPPQLKPLPPPPSAASQQSASTVGEQGTRIAPAPQQMDYRAILIAWLNGHKQYPSEAADERLKGKTVVRCTIDPQGRVLSATISRSSGYAVLDQAALDMFARSNPVPAFPPAMAQEPMTLTLSIEFARPLDGDDLIETRIGAPAARLR